MAKRKKKIVYRNVKKHVVDEEKKVKSDIQDLENKRQALGGGFRNFLRKAAVTNQINNKRKFISSGDRLRNTKRDTELGKALLEKEKVKMELGELKKKSQVNFNDLYNIR